MATKGKKSKTVSTEAKVTRIKATDTKAPKKKTTETSAKVETETSETKERRNPFVATGEYFKGAWYELKQVRWPTRRATWGMTAALLVFTTFFVIFILLLDALFKYLFELILG